MDKKNTDEGAIFANRKTSQGSPDFTGTIKISRELLGILNGKERNSEELSIRVAGWKNQSRDGRNYLKLKVSDDDYQKGAPQPAGGYQQRGGYPPKGGYPRQPDMYQDAPPQQNAYRQQSTGAARAPVDIPPANEAPWDDM